MKKVFKGWIGKAEPMPMHWNDTRNLTITYYAIEKHRGKEADWNPEDWPPRKVTVTVEVEE